jgi:DNA-binding transcriptional ArsR family regulator
LRAYIYTAMNVNTFEVLADPTRRRIIGSLQGGEQPVGEIVKQCGIQQSGVSRHLRILQQAGFVSMRAQGQRHLYALRPEPFQEIDVWLSGYRNLWEGRLDRFAAALEKRRPARIPRRKTRTRGSA